MSICRIAGSRWVDNGALAPNWNVISLGKGIFQLRYDNTPIEDFELIEGANIREVKLYGANFVNLLQKVEKQGKGELRPPVIMEMASMASRVDKT